MKILVLGYGNVGRLDDGLGPALAAAVEKLGFANVSTDSDYQLVVEDAVELARHDLVIFADADSSSAEPFYFRRISPEPQLSFSSHSVQPAALLGLASELFGATTRGYVLGIRGYEFNEFGEGLSEGARHNLDAALAFLSDAIRKGEFSDYCTDKLKTA